ncbi:hypothetical protein K474DRAFT_1660225 [Panus rudis PR-1116 ss-1]|nr:hypothetical protein K474DRAFT_1660225 [Panus rudis PR-1116 ss-1]
MSHIDVGGSDELIDPLNIHNKEVRHFYRQCQKCWKRRSATVKLQVCSQCKITAYCSRECQKADWKFHKTACKANQEHLDLMAMQDFCEVVEAMAEGRELDRPLTSQVNAEIGEWLRRFRPFFCQAGWRCLIRGIGPNAWSTHIFQVRIERIRNPSPDSRPWTRYKVVDAGAVPISRLLETHANNQHFKDILKQGEAYHEENARTGCIGTIMTILKCDSSGQDIEAVSWAGYGPDAWHDSDNWFQELRDAVEKVSGRA